MHWKPKRWTLIGLLALAIPVIAAGYVDVAVAQSAIATTQVTDTVYRADGTLATGTVIVSWQAFTTALGESVPSGTTSAAIGPNGALSVSLAPNAGSTPMGTYYTAVYHLDDGTVSREFWVVPASQTAVTVSSIETSILPASVAMQTVSKSYVDTAIATAISGHPLNASSPYVLVTGSAMTGALTLPADPVTATQAADKHYVDTSVASLTSGLGQKVSLLPAGTQTVSQPVGTQLQVSQMNGQEYASQYVTGLGGNGVANAVASPDCVSGCNVTLDRSYTAVEGYTPSTWNSGAGGTHLEDDRSGQRRDSYMNPTSSVGNGEDAGQVVDVTSTRSSAAEFATGTTSDPSSFGLVINHQGLTGGSNLFPKTIENVPYFKTNYQAIAVTGTYNTMGQHSLNGEAINCYGVGDCLIGSQFITSSGGVRDEADEGAHPFDLQIEEDYRVFEGTCSAGCTAGSTVVNVAVSSGGGTQGEGRYLIDKSPAQVLTAGSLTGGGFAAPGATATFSGTSFPVSVFLATAATIPSQAKNVAPGTVTVTIASSGVAAGFATSTTAIPGSSGVACVTDQPNSTNPHNYEMATYSVIDATHLQMTLNKVHRAGATIAFGGLCGYGLEQTVDTVGQVRQVFPVIGSYSATGLYYAGGITPIVGVQGNTSAFLNVVQTIASLARSGGVVTVTTAGNLPVDVNGLTMTVSGAVDQSYNGSFAVTSTGGNTLTYAQTGANSTTSGGTVAVLTGGYVLYPMAEVLGVFDAAARSVDGQLTLAANTVAWAANDPLEEPHYYQQVVSGDVEFIGQTTPRPTTAQTAGVQYEYNVGPGLSGWTVDNAAPATNYLGNGGTHSIPHAAFEDEGIWQFGMEMQAGEESVFRVHCNSHGCGRWNSGYNVFEFDGNTRQDQISYQPLTSTLGMNFGGGQFSFGAGGFTATTINAGTVNATTLNGAVSAAQLPVFGASGAGHARGAVPDPGATAGAVRYLREDGSWDVPVGSGASGQSVAGAFSTGPQAIAGAEADYNFLQGAGTVLTDMSGSGNNGTLGAGGQAPAWTTNGLAFSSASQNVVLPSTLNGARTIYTAFYSSGPALNYAANVPNNVIQLVSSSLGTTGFNLTLTDFEGVNGAPMPLAIAGGAQQTGSGVMLSGFNVLAMTLGAGGGDSDHLYLNGVEMPYTRVGQSAGLQGSGNLYLGGSNTGAFNGDGFVGTYYRAVFKATEDTAAQVALNSAAIVADMHSRGVPVTAQSRPQQGATLFAVGDSITYGLGLGNPATQAWPVMLSLTNQPAYNVVNAGIPSITAKALAGAEPNRVAPYCTTAQGPSVAIFFAGTNDLADSIPPASVVASMARFVAEMHTAGCRAFLGTTLPDGTTGDAVKNTLDALILTSAKGVGADGVVDFAANPLLGADGAYTNATYFQGDHIHPTAAGQQLLANAASNVLNYFFGYSETNPHVVTTLPYSMAAGDGEVSLAGLTGAGTVTLPDCTGQSGAVYRINNPQSGFAVTVAPLNGSELINGLAAATTVTVPANGTLTLRDVPNAKTVSGCHWEM